MIVFITIRVIAALCPRVGLSQPQTGTNRNPALASCAWSTYWVTLGEQTRVISRECRSADPLVSDCPAEEGYLSSLLKRIALPTELRAHIYFNLTEMPRVRWLSVQPRILARKCRCQFWCQLVDPSATPLPAFRQQPICEQAPNVRIASSSGSSYGPSIQLPCEDPRRPSPSGSRTYGESSTK
jgi:hypothetical protein